eukprot:UN03623
MKMVGAILEKYFDHDFVRTQVNVRTAKTLFLWERGLECLKIAYQNGFLEEFLHDKSVKPTKRGYFKVGSSWRKMRARSLTSSATIGR